MIKAILFDMDGTLADTVPLIVETSRKAALELGVSLSDEAIKSMIGLPLVETGEKLCGAGLGQRYFDLYQKHYFGENAPRPRLFPGARGLLAGCRRLGAKIAVVTSKSYAGARHSMESTGLNELCDALITAGDVRQPKPDREPALKALNLLRAEADNAVFVGDSVFDLICGRQAGMAVCAVTWGAGKEAELIAQNPDFTARRMNELESYLTAFLSS